MLSGPQRVVALASITAAVVALVLVIGHASCTGGCSCLHENNAPVSAVGKKHGLSARQGPQEELQLELSACDRRCDERLRATLGELEDLRAEVESELEDLRAEVEALRLKMLDVPNLAESAASRALAFGGLGTLDRSVVEGAHSGRMLLQESSPGARACSKAVLESVLATPSANRVAHVMDELMKTDESCAMCLILASQSPYPDVTLGLHGCLHQNENQCTDATGLARIVPLLPNVTLQNRDSVVELLELVEAVARTASSKQ
jgi:hypothetical protein